MQDHQFQLNSGRNVGYREYGPKDGKPVFYFHGSPSSRVELEIFSDEEFFNSKKIRVFAVDRPGMGISDFQPGRKILDWPEDILALAKSLKIDRFSILAYSLGGPYGLACAYALPKHLNRVAIVSGSALFTITNLMEKINQGTKNYINLPREKPFAARLFLRLMRSMTFFAPRFMVKNAKSLLPDPDKLAVSDLDTQEAFIGMLREAFRQGIKGSFQDSLLAVQNWGFHLRDIKLPVLIWHGDVDQNIPVVMAHHAADEIHGSELKIFEGEGHLSLFKNHIEEIFHSVVD
jgi:pimeloyl-ACP methyl ester carboxylesterase